MGQGDGVFDAIASHRAKYSLQNFTFPKKKANCMLESRIHEDVNCPNN